MTATLTMRATAATERIEVYPIETLDLSTAQLLHGGTPDTPAARQTIAGELRLPTTPDVRVPAVIFMHGDLGAFANQPQWIDDLNAAGIAVFTVDSFSGRGRVSTAPGFSAIDGALPGSTTRVVDAYRALAVLATHPRIDPARIALMGVSSGGRTALFAAMKRFSSPLALSNARFAAYVALYAPCNTQLVDDERRETGPLRIYVGAADRLVQAGACERFVARLRKAGVDADVTVYPAAVHGFDNPRGRRLVQVPDEPTFADCAIVERGERLVNADTGAPPTLDDRCVVKGFSAGRDDAADAAVREAVRGFLARTLSGR